MKPIKLLIAFCAVLAGIALLNRVSAEEPGAALAGGNARVVFVGDSITGQGRNRPRGFVNVMEIALRTVYPGSNPDLVALGGSGQPVDGWLNVEATSREEEKMLDVRDLGVKASLDRPADVLVVMLGMNDVIAPYLDGSDAALDGWIERYARLLEALRQRVQPKVVAIGGVTLCTEDFASPKNRLIDRMNQRLRELAGRTGSRYLETSETMKEVLQKGRRITPEFHLSDDYVHPNDAGHLAVAIGMLRGLGEPEAAQWLADERLGPIFSKEIAKREISWEILSALPEGTDGRFSFRVRYDWPESNPEHPPRVKLLAPDGWIVTPEMIEGSTGKFTLTGAPDRLQNRFTLEGRSGEDERRTDGALAAPWLLAAKLIQPNWSGDQFDVEKAGTAIDEAIGRGVDFTAPLEAESAPKLTWQPFFPNGNYLGGENPSNVDFSAITHAVNFEAGYGVRWIHSDRERAVKLKVDSRMFAGDVHLLVWINGRECFRGGIMKEPRREKTVEAALQKGWNTLAFKANHRTWLWQFAVGLIGNDGDSLADLRYSIEPHPFTRKASEQ